MIDKRSVLDGLQVSFFSGECRGHPLKVGYGEQAKFGRLYHNPFHVPARMACRYLGKLCQRFHMGKLLGVVEGGLHVGVDRSEYIGTIHGCYGNGRNSLV